MLYPTELWDPLVPNQVRYRTAPHSEDSIILRGTPGVKFTPSWSKKR